MLLRISSAVRIAGMLTFKMLLRLWRQYESVRSVIKRRDTPRALDQTPTEKAIEDSKQNAVKLYSMNY